MQASIRQSRTGPAGETGRQEGVPAEFWLENGQTLYVHLCSGRVVEVHPATSVSMTDEALIVLDEDKVVATFPRSNVYFVADEPMEPPPLE